MAEIILTNSAQCLHLCLSRWHLSNRLRNKTYNPTTVGMAAETAAGAAASTPAATTTSEATSAPPDAAPPAPHA